MECSNFHQILIHFSSIYFVMQLIQISGSVPSQIESNYCYLDFFSSAKLGINDNVQFDFSRINKRSWKNIPYIKDGMNYTFHFSLCPPVDNYKTSTPCSLSLSCVTKKVGNNAVEVIQDAGRYFSRFIYKNNQLQMTLQKSTEQCHGGVYKTVFKMNCSTVEQTPVLNTEDPCSFVVLWIHPVACPVINFNLEKSCVLHEAGFKFDLRPLTWHLIMNKEKKKKFEAKICGNRNQGKCIEPDVTVCYVTKSNTVAIAKGNNTKLIYDRLKSLFLLKYLNSTGEAQAEIQFLCDNKSFPGELLKVKDQMIFQMYTSLACPMELQSHCFVWEHNGDSYNLETLRNEYKNYEIDGYKKEMKYIFNFCGPLLRTEQRHCDGLICLWDLFSNSSMNLGTRILLPSFDGTSMVYHFVGGDYCPHGGTNSVKFILECHHSYQPPQYTSLDSSTCTHLFLWKTPTACPFQYSKGKDCKIKDEFDLNPIRKQDGDYKVTEQNEIFDINICGDMINPCNIANDSGICWTHKDSESIVIGNYSNSELEYFNGHISLSMTGDNCTIFGPKSRVVITFTCEMDLSKSSFFQPHLHLMDIEHCFFNFLWPTPQACKSHQKDIEIKCDTTDSDGYTYDLSPLTRTNSNYVINYNKNGDNLIILLNVCQPVVLGSDVICSSLSGICQINTNGNPFMTNRPRYLNLGDVIEPVFKDDMLRMDYKPVGFCQFEKSNQHSYSTVIDFICNPDIEESEPQLIEINQCKYRFIWETKIACPVKQISRAYSLEDPSLHCTILSPNTKKRIDLRALMDQDYSIKTHKGKNLDFAVCRTLPTKYNEGVKLSNKSGALLDGKNAGVANNKLQYHKGAILLKYQDGDVCVAGRKYVTLIQFVCNPNAPSTGPEFLDTEDKCTVIVNFETSLACEKKIDCVATSRTEDYNFDLSPLISNNKNYQVKVGNNTIFINVCRPLLVIQGLKCPVGSSVCHANQQNYTYVNEVSLGYLGSSPVLEADKSVWLRYSHGNTCNINPNKNYSTSIQFICDPTVRVGQPRSREDSGCEYTFEWKTSYVCVDKKNHFDSKRCIIYDSEDHQILKLNSGNNNYAIKTTSAMGVKYKLQLCNTSGNAQYFLCRQMGNAWISFGKPQEVLFHYSDNSTVIKFRNGSKCNDKETFVAEVSLKCDPHHNTDNSKPYIRLESACAVFMEWSSSALCYHKIPDYITEDLPEITAELGTATKVSVPVLAAQDEATTPLPKEESSSNTLFIFKLIFCVTILLVIIAVIIYYIKKKLILREIDSTSFTMIENPASPEVRYSRVRLKTDEKAKLI